MEGSSALPGVTGLQTMRSRNRLMSSLYCTWENTLRHPTKSTYEFPLNISSWWSFGDKQPDSRLEGLLMFLPDFKIVLYQDKIIYISLISPLYTGLWIFETCSLSHLFLQKNHYSTTFLCQTLHETGASKTMTSFCPHRTHSVSYCSVLTFPLLQFLFILPLFYLVLMYTSPRITYILLKARFAGEISKFVYSKLDDKMTTLIVVIGR